MNHVAPHSVGYTVHDVAHRARAERKRNRETRERIFDEIALQTSVYPGVIAGGHGAPVVGVVALRGWTIVE